MHRIFTIDEILATVVAHLEPDEQSNSRRMVHSGRYQRLYLPLVTVSRTFSSVALDALWKEIVGTGAINCLRTMMDGPDASPIRYQMYVVRVRSLSIPNLEEDTSFFERRRPMFPRLKCLTFTLDSAIGNVLRDILFLLCPTVASLCIEWGKMACVSGAETFHSDLAAMCAASPSLEKLCMDFDHLKNLRPEQRQCAMHAVGRLQHIRVLEISVKLVMCPDIIHVASALPHLQELRLLNVDQHWLADSDILQGESDGFRHLEVLAIGGFLPDVVLTLLRRFPPCPVAHLELRFYDDVSVQAQMSFVQAVCDRFSETLRRLKFHISTPDFTHSPLDLGALLLLRDAHLEYIFAGEFDPYYLSDQLCHDMAYTWHSLRSVCLTPCTDRNPLDMHLRPPRASFAALMMFAKYCPLLVSLRIELDLTTALASEGAISDTVAPQNSLIQLHLDISPVEQPKLVHKLLLKYFPSLQCVVGYAAVQLMPSEHDMGREELCSMFQRLSADDFDAFI